jgi:hypothetical protein
MPETDLGAIHNQMDLSRIAPLPFQPLPGDGLIPFAHPYGRVGQQSAQAAGQREQLRRTGNLPRNPAQIDRSALKNPHHQPREVAHLGNSLTGSQFHNSAFPGIIKAVGRHWVTPFLKGLCKTNFSGEPLPINYSVVKVSGN